MNYQSETCYQQQPVTIQPVTIQPVTIQPVNRQPLSYPINCHDMTTAKAISIKRKLQQNPEEHTNKKRLLAKLPEDDGMMIEDEMMITGDELTDEDDLSPSPSTMEYFYNLPTVVEEDLDKGGFTGQLELGWSDMYYDIY